jgi:hypothetical protein
MADTMLVLTRKDGVLVYIAASAITSWSRDLEDDTLVKIDTFDGKFHVVRESCITIFKLWQESQK